MNEPSKHLEESTLQIILPGAPIVGVFYTNNKRGLQYHTFPVLSWSHEQEHQRFILVLAPLAEVIVQCPTVCY
jgi:hypothetical protein